MRNSKYLQILGICTLFSVTACSSKLEIPEPPVYNKVRNISVDLNQEMQTIDGFGASDAWQLSDGRKILARREKKSNCRLAV